MADGGVMMGLPRAEALELASQSKSDCYLSASSKLIYQTIALQGTARLALQSDAHPAQIKDAVTSK